MKAWVLLAILITNVQCMTEKDKGGAQCILHHIAEFEKGAPEYAAVREAHGYPDAPHFATQFGETDPVCPSELTFVKEADGNRVGAIYITPLRKVTIEELSETFGEFKYLPPSPAGKWSAIARYDSGNTKQTYAIIGSAMQKIDAKSHLTITIRIDYED